MNNQINVKVTINDVNDKLKKFIEKQINEFINSEPFLSRCYFLTEEGCRNKENSTNKCSYKECPLK